MHRRSTPARLCFLKRLHHLASGIPAVLCMENQTIKCKVGFFARAGIGKLSDSRVLECGRGIADFSKAIDSAGSRKAVRDTLDSTQRTRQPASSLQQEAVL